MLFLFLSLSIWLLSGVVVMASTESRAERKLDQTPTWAVASVCAVIILISISLEKILHKLGSWFTDRHKRALFDALEKVKAELMVLGFISLILTFCQSYIIKICISERAADTMLPCPLDGDSEKSSSSDKEEHRRRLLWFDRRFLNTVASAIPPCKEGYEPLITEEALHQLHILIFFLAVFHVIYSCITMMLGRLKIRGWKKWELETLSHDYEFSTDPSRFRLTHETSFVRAHTSFWTRIPVFFYVGCFLRQFFKSVSRADYLTLRNGFINVHLAPGSKFDFQKYIKRSLEDDFKLVVGVSPLLWAWFVVFLLINVNGWHALFWASLIPLIIILAIGIELQSVLTKMALEITERHTVVQGIPLVQGSDKYFWFGRPQLVLHLIHFALFQNAFQITYFLWIWYLFGFGLDSCSHDNIKLASITLALGVGVLFLCSYITLPLYSLVAQMGSRMKKTVFDEQTSKAIKKWHMAVKKKHRKDRKSLTLTPGGGATPSSSPFSSAGHTLQRFRTTGHLTRSYTYEDHAVSPDHEVEPLSSGSSNGNFVINMDNDNDQATEIVETQRVKESNISFVKGAPAKEP